MFVKGTDTSGRLRPFIAIPLISNSEVAPKINTMPIELQQLDSEQIKEKWL